MKLSLIHIYADPDHPALLFSGDFKGDGSSELIEAYYEGDKLYPWRSRRDVAVSYTHLDVYKRQCLSS